MNWPLPARNQPASQAERFATPLNVMAIFSAFMLVLVLLYPEQGLLGVLSGGNDAATLRYREALLRMRPDDLELRFKVAAAQVQYGHARRALNVLAAMPATLNKDQKQQVLELRYMALRDLLIDSRDELSQWRNLRAQVAEAAAALGGDNPPAWRLRMFEDGARKAGDTESADAYALKAAAKEQLENTAPNDAAAEALSAGHFRKAAEICFRWMREADSLEKRRTLFMRAVSALQAGNMPKEAFAEGERNIGMLHNDRTTLIFLTRAGLAAGQPASAQKLIRRALGISSERRRSAGT